LEVESLELNDVGMADNAHDLELSVLEALVLQHALDGGILTRRRQFGLENDTEGAIADDLALGVLHLLGLPSKAVLDLLTDDFSHSEA